MASLSKKKLNIDEYGYSVYNEYVNRYSENALKYGNRKGLSVRYYHINLESSENYSDDIGIQLSAKQFAYDLYDFIPLIDATPPTQQIYYDQNEQGTSYVSTFTCTIINVKNPLPGDLLHYYTSGDSSNLDETEIYRVKRVNYIRSLNKSKKIYSLELESAPFKKSSLDNFTIKNHYYYDYDIDEFFTEDQYVYKEYLEETDLKDYLDSCINENTLNYNAVSSSYGQCKLDVIISSLSYFKETHSYIEKLIDYNIEEFMYIFDRYHFDLGINPITNEPITFTMIQEDDPGTIENETRSEYDINQNQFNSLEYNGDQDVNLNLFDSNQYNIYKNTPYDFKDLICNAKDDLMYSPEYAEESLINQTEYKTILEKTVQEVSDPADRSIITYNVEYNKSNDFEVYLELYKRLFCYRELKPDFYASIKEFISSLVINNEIELPEDLLYYDVLGETPAGSINRVQYTGENPYQDFYYLTYQEGVHISTGMNLTGD